MSIRLKLTLIYSAILTLTLVIFGVALYTIQSQDTLNALEEDLIMSSQRMVEGKRENPPETQNPPPPPQENDTTSETPFFDNLKEREIARVLDAEGNLLASPFGYDQQALPLTVEGLLTLQNGQDWWQEGIINDEPMLIYNHAIMRNGELLKIIQVARSTGERERTLSTLATTLGAAGILTVLIAFGIGWVLSGVTLQPIKRMTKTARKIGEKRDFSRRVNYEGPQDEIGQLADTFNQMLCSLQEAYEKVEHSLELQRDFVADVSHELRTPLTTLRGNLGLLKRKPPAPPEMQEDIVNDMVDESDRLIRLVNELLMLARTDAGRSFTIENIKVQPILEEIIRQTKTISPQRKLNLVNYADIEVKADRDALKQVLLILVDNALKHSDKDIDIFAQKGDDAAQVRVRDHGEGISPETLENIFMRFYRGKEEANVSGFGLGLPIAKSLIEGMGGGISVESKLGKGSEVEIWLPLA